MSTAERAAEATEASIAYQAALSRIGAATVQQAIRLWAGVPPIRKAATADAWLAQAVELVMTQRGPSRALAMSYYRLVRALRTGRTVADPARPVPPYVTLADLRREFAGLTAGVTIPGHSAPRPATPPARPDDDTRIPVEKLPNVAVVQAAAERAAVLEARDNLRTLGPDNLAKKLGRIDETQPAAQVDQLRAQAHREAGARQAASAARIAMNGARSTTWAMQEQDRAVLGWARVSLTGTPCGWCAMLISRGAVYKSQRGAQYSDGDRYHDNDHCVAEPLFGGEQIGEDRFALNREYQKLWPTVTAGHQGDDKLTAWRRYFRAQQNASAPAAKPDSSAQEASP